MWAEQDEQVEWRGQGMPMIEFQLDHGQMGQGSGVLRERERGSEGADVVVKKAYLDSAVA